ncbi:LysR substrate-binding domain-containing protein [Ochrobactrum sp. EDr1-4]|uniref:LysR substrate-binding domain-containing protein n=1 Tax=Ochrobactrum sp. EDr1-4 TaxID=3368622 RepID=UPI003BA37C87
MIAVGIGPDWRLIAVASPGYLQTHGIPKHPNDLLNHMSVNQTQNGGRSVCMGIPKKEKPLHVRVDGQLAFINSDAMIDAVASGFGVAFLSEDTVRRQFSDGTLQIVLDNWSPKFDGYYLYYPS